MRWGQRYNYVRPARPKARSLKADEAEQISTRLKAAIGCSPILSAFGLRVSSLRGRFYLEWRWDPVDQPEEVSSHGRITPRAVADRSEGSPPRLAPGDIAKTELKPGMTFTIEPGLYNDNWGGVRLENTVTLTQKDGKLLIKKFNGISTKYFFPLYHPAAALYDGSMREVLIEDFKKIPKVLKEISARGGSALG